MPTLPLKLTAILFASLLCLVFFARAEIDLGFLDDDYIAEEDQSPAEPEPEATEPSEEPTESTTEEAEPEQDVNFEIGEIGTTGEEDATVENAGTMTGRVLDTESGGPLQGVTVILGDADQYVGVTNAAGQYTIENIPPGTYDISFNKAAYRPGIIRNKVIEPNATVDGSFPMEPAPVGTADETFVLDAIEYEATEVGELMIQLEGRLDADRLVNLFGAEDFARFGAGDVAEALQRVSGVSVVEGQFAVIRGLSDRYSSVTFMGSPVPSPDPTRQSVQLDLFPSDIVSNLEISKSFAPELPGNSAAGSIDIIADNFPDEPMLKVGAGFGLNSNTRRDYLIPQSGSALPSSIKGGESPTKHDFGVSLGITHEWKDRDLRFYYGYSQAESYGTDIGWEEGREPRLQYNDGAAIVGGLPTLFIMPGSLAKGDLPLSDGRWNTNDSSSTTRYTHFVGAGFDFDKEGNHSVNFSLFNNIVEENKLSFQSDGFFPTIDYSQSTLDVDDQLNTGNLGSQVTTTGTFLWDALNNDFSDVQVPELDSTFYLSKSLARERELTIYQGNGSHTFEGAGGLQVNWVVNESETQQRESARKLGFWSYPRDTFNYDEGEFVLTSGTGQAIDSGDDNAVFFNANEISETMGYQSIAAEYEFEVIEPVTVTLSAGVDIENSDRDVLATVALVDAQTMLSSAPTPGQVESIHFDPANISTSTIDSSANRDVTAKYFTLKTSIAEVLDVFGGVRLEDLVLGSNNNPFFSARSTSSGFNPDGGIYPNRYLMFDTFDGSAQIGPLNDPAGRFGDFGNDFSGLALPNYKLLNIDMPDYMFDANGTLNPSEENLRRILSQEIDRELTLPSVGFNIKPVEGLSIRGVYTDTYARPSFRELGYYVSTDIGSEDLVVGNPLLKLSKVISKDLRAEYVWGEGDLLAISYFQKNIDNPIEKIKLNEPLNNERFQTFYNNPNSADLSGFEFEVRKNLDFIKLDNFTIGGNYTLIDASVKRTQAQIDAYDAFYYNPDLFAFPNKLPREALNQSKLPSERRLFEQPEWIANLDITYDNPEWGTTLTLAYFAISDILKTVGSVNFSAALPNRPESAVLDEYSESFEQVNLVIRQQWKGWTFGFSIKNLTDTERKVFYDDSVTNGKIYKSSYKVGRDYSFSASYSF